MQANYTKNRSLTYWDPVHLNYPVRKFPETGRTSETIGREWRLPPDVLHELKRPIPEEKEYCKDYNVTKNLSRSQTTIDFGRKLSETERFNKHTSYRENLYIYPLSRKLEDRTPAHKVHGTSEMRSAFTKPCVPARLITDKNQFKHPTTLPMEPPATYPEYKELEPLDTTYEGFEKYLDPYLTTNRLNHKPFTTDILKRSSNTKNVLTYYSHANVPWVRGPKPNVQEWGLPLSKSKPVYDREKFKEGFREIRTHNKLNWVPRTFHTEVRDNYVEQKARPESKIHNYEEEAKSNYQRSLACLQTNIHQQDSAIKKLYSTENSHYGSKRQISSIIDQFVEINKRILNKRDLVLN